MQITKKLYTTLIIAVLTISALMAAIPMASAEIMGDPLLCAASPPGSTAPLTEGPPGTRVAVVGNSTGGNASAFSTVTVYWDALSGIVLGSGSADNNGDYRITVTIPPATFGEHWIVVNDGETESGGAAFNVTAGLTVNTSPPYPSYMTPQALPGDSITVTGHGFSANKQITLFMNQTTDPTISFTITTPIFTTNATGSFSGTIQVPSINMTDFDLFDVNATDSLGHSAVDQIMIDYYITCMPDQGPTGITTMISGRIAPSVVYEVRFNNAPIATGTTDGAGSYMEFYTIPAVLSEATYQVSIWWGTNNRTANFTVTPTPVISLGATSGVAGDIVTISGENFTAYAGITLYFDTTIVNSTDMGTGFGPTGYTMFDYGKFSEVFVVPTLVPGTYAVKVVDANGATSAPGVFFTVLPTPETTVAIRAAAYYPMDIISFNIQTTETSLGTITVTITDPTGTLWWTTTDWELSAGAMKSVVYQNQTVGGNYLNLPADAPLGNWNWTITYTPASSGTVTTATGLFAVIMKPSMQTVVDQLNSNTTSILDAIDDCCTDLTDLLLSLGANITEMKGEVATIETTVGVIEVALSDLDATITGFDGDMATIQTSLGTVQTTVSSLNTDITTIKTSVNGVASTVDSMDDVVGLVAGDTAYLKSAITNMTGTITDISDGVATIQTDIGTLKVDVASIKTDVTAVQTDVEESLPVTVDMMPVWIAVILSLIAAIAAIFAVVTIRQKIAG